MPLLGHKMHGQGPEKVIFFNDWMGDCTSWTPVLPYLDAERFTYALVDLRGYGRSIQLRGEYTETEAATDILAFTDHLGWDRFHLLGFSMTGMVVERLAIDVPQRINSVVAIAAVSAAVFKMSQELRRLAIESITNDNKATGLQEFAFSDRLSTQWKRFKLRASRQTRSWEAARATLTCLHCAIFLLSVADETTHNSHMSNRPGGNQKTRLHWASANFFDCCGAQRPNSGQDYKKDGLSRLVVVSTESSRLASQLQLVLPLLEP